MKQTNPDTPDMPDAPQTPPSVTGAGEPAPLETTPPPPPTDETIKETLESIIIAFILAFVFRAFIVEAFVIPTGSMAPTLLGAHYRVQCEQCGYDFKINYGDSHRAQYDSRTGRKIAPARWENGAVCPMCHYHINMAPFARPCPGDRILVHKYIYTVSEPRRWDVVVFKAPHQPDTNFIKRLVGLPNESIRLLDGNVYTQYEGQTAWKIARKGDSPKVQRAVWQPIYHSQYVPRDHGDLRGPGERTAQFRWSTPWIVKSGNWDVQNLPSYVYHGGEEGLIEFDFRSGRTLSLASIYPYNQYDSPGINDTIEDIRLGVALQPDSTDCRISLSTQTRIENEAQTIEAGISVDGTVTLQVKEPGSEQMVDLLPPVQADPLEMGIATPIELWVVDQELSVWVDGKRVMRYLYADELTPTELINRPPPLGIPEVSIRMAGGAATLHRVELDRDLYYATTNPNGTLARGGLKRDALGRVMVDRIKPMRLYDDEYFCIGDNGPLSDDGRFWSPADGDPNALWVRQRYFGKALDDESRDGVVPGELMMGRAFFVYFPAPYNWSGNTRGVRVIPNFADMRFIH